MILCAKSFSQTDPGRKPGKFIWFHTPYPANKIIRNSFEIPRQLAARSCISLAVIRDCGMLNNPKTRGTYLPVQQHLQKNWLFTHSNPLLSFSV